MLTLFTSRSRKMLDDDEVWLLMKSSVLQGFDDDTSDPSNEGLSEEDSF